MIGIKKAIQRFLAPQFVVSLHYFLKFRAFVSAKAEVEIEGFDKATAGRLLDVAREPEFTPHYALTERESAHLVYQARIALDDAPVELRPGLPARVDLTLTRPAATSG